MTTDQRLDRIDKKLNSLMQATATKALWVRVSFVLEVTGWNREKLRQAREQGIIKYEKRKTGLWYDINSLPQIFQNGTNA